MHNGNHAKKAQFSFGSILYWAVGILLVCTLLTVWLVSGLFAKYITSGGDPDAAHVAGTGVKTLEVREHEASEFPKVNSGEYRLDLLKEVSGNTYEKVLPGVDIPKDPFVRLELENAEVDYELYLTVTETNFPFDVVTGRKMITYELTDEWELQPKLSDETKGIYVYKYKTYFDAGMNYTRTETLPKKGQNRSVIWILKKSRLYVSEHYYGGDPTSTNTFSLTFEAQLKQVD